jgi:hypothetical protein
MKLNWEADSEDLRYVKAVIPPWTFKITVRDQHPDLGVMKFSIDVGDDELYFQQTGTVTGLRDIAELLADYKLVKREDKGG